MARIADLSAKEVARRAIDVFIFSGRNEYGARLIFHALQLNPYEAEALRALSDFFDHEGTEQFAAVVLEYALAPESPLRADERQPLDELRFLSLWTWGFSRHISDNPSLEAETFHQRDQFIVDEARYQAFVGSIVRQGGSLPGAFQAAHRLLGVMCGLLTHKTLGSTAPMGEIFDPEVWETTRGYGLWLEMEPLQLQVPPPSGFDPSRR